KPDQAPARIAGGVRADLLEGKQPAIIRLLLAHEGLFRLLRRIEEQRWSNSRAPPCNDLFRAYVGLWKTTGSRQSMAHHLRRTLVRKFGEELRFFKGWIDKPRAVGANMPTSTV